jgi:hypothetical protein
VTRRWRAQQRDLTWRWKNQKLHQQWLVQSRCMLAFGSLATAISDSLQETRTSKWAQCSDDGGCKRMGNCSNFLSRNFDPKNGSQASNMQRQCGWSDWQCPMIKPKSCKLKTLISLSWQILALQLSQGRCRRSPQHMVLATTLEEQTTNDGAWSAVSHFRKGKTESR